MRRARFIALGAAGAALTGSMGAVALAPSADSWVATHTQAIPLQLPLLGQTPLEQKLTLSVSLPQRNRAELDRLAVAVSTPGTKEFGHFLTPQQTLARFGPTASTVASVSAYLRKEGFQDLTVASNHLVITATATVKQAQHAFRTRISNFALNGKTVHVNTRAASVPSRLAGSINAVLGLSNLPMSTDLKHYPHSTDITASGIDARATQKIYNITGLPTASKMTIGLTIAGDVTPIIKELRRAERIQHFTPVDIKVVHAVPQSAEVDNPMTDNLEWALDTQISTMVAGAVKQLILYNVGTYTDSDVALAINRFAADGEAIGLSSSLGECDFVAWLDGAMILTDGSLAQAAAQGMTHFASTGDNGFACPYVASTGVPGGVPGLSWPSSGEYTTAIGGTTVTADSKGNLKKEVAWIGGGGGISPYATAGPWQFHENVAGQAWIYLNQGGRGAPDVSALADGSGGYLVYGAQGDPTGVGGTSVSSPLMLGIWARLQALHGGRLGHAAIRFYHLYTPVNPGTTIDGPIGGIYLPQTGAAPVAGFRDITSGSNGLYPATKGWDYATGIGVLNVAKLAQLLKAEVPTQP